MFFKERRDLGYAIKGVFNEYEGRETEIMKQQTEVKVIKVEFPKGLEMKIKKRAPKDMFLRRWYTHIMELGLKAAKDAKSY